MSKVPDNSPDEVLLRVRGVTVRFPGVTALDDVHFDLKAGEIHCLLGENGAGKSTLSKILSGVQTDFEGELLLSGAPVHFKHVRDAWRHKIGMIHQELNLVPELTVFENVFLGRERQGPLGVQRQQTMASEAQRFLERLGADLSPYQKVRQLRVSERQLVEIAKALSLDARILIMDEPTSALSSTEVEHLFGVMRKLRASGVAIIYISHRLDEVFRIADRITVLRDGKHIITAPAQTLSRSKLIRYMVGREVQDAHAHGRGNDGVPLLKVHELSLKRPGVVSLDAVSFEVRRGEVVGVAGLMGSGQTELLETLFGAHPPRFVTGDVTFGSKRRRFRDPAEAIAAGLGYVSEDRKAKSLVLADGVRFNASLVALRSFAGLLGRVQRRPERRAVQEQVDALGIRTPGLETPVGALSGGNQQKVVLAKFLLSKPRLLLLNEPTRGIDVGAKAQVYELLSELAARGTACLLASSELLELLAVCDRILVLCEGRLSAQFTREDASQEAILDAAMQFRQAA